MYVVVVEVFFVLEMLVGNLDGGSKKKSVLHKRSSRALGEQGYIWPLLGNAEAL